MLGGELKESGEILDARGGERGVEVEGEQAEFEISVVFVELDAVGGEAQKVLGRGDLALLKESLEEQLKKPRGGDVKLFTQGFARHAFVEGVILVMLLETLDSEGASVVEYGGMEKMRGIVIDLE